METLGRIVLMLGVVLLILGFLLIVLGRIAWVGQLPGDINLRWGNVSCFFPIVTSIVLSILATIVLNVVLWLLRK